MEPLPRLARRLENSRPEETETTTTKQTSPLLKDLAESPSLGLVAVDCLAA